jgi:ketosteroid isomerase-like protein
MSAAANPVETGNTKAEQLAERYTAVWMEPDGDRRRQMIAEVWSEDAIHLLQPTQEVYEAADERAVNPTWQVRGHDELDARVTKAYEDFVASGLMSFRLRDGAKRLGDVVTWRWEGVSPDGEVLGAGLEFVILAADGRIATDYQFVE